LLAVALGFSLFALVTGLATPAAMRAFDVTELATFQMQFFVVNLVYTVLAALAAGYLTGRIAGKLEIPHAAAVGMIAIVAGFLQMQEHGAITPGPYEMTTAGCGPISAMIGAAVAMVQRLRLQK
jgi:hypothetical protein